MPNGLHLSDADFYAATITAKQYLLQLESYLERMLAFGATDEDTARRWFQQALTALGYKDYATYETQIERDTRTINPPTVPGVLTPAMVMPGLQLPSPQALPYFKQVVAPIVYRGEAERQALQYGYVDEKGNIVNETAYNTLLRNAIQDAETYKYKFIQENLQYQEDTARAAGEAEKAERLAENLRKVDFFFAQQRGEEATRERAILEAQQRGEAWAEQEAAGAITGREPLAPIPTGEPAIREFLEEERPAGIQRFIRGKLPSVLERFEREQVGARRAWWGAIQRPDQERALAEAEFEQRRWLDIRTKGLKAGLGTKLPSLEAQLGRPLQAQDVTPDEWAFYIAQRKWMEYGQEAGALRGLTSEQITEAYPTPTAEEMEDPLKRYLAEYPWQAEFFKLSPSQRGFYPSRYAPSARWFT